MNDDDFFKEFKEEDDDKGEFDENFHTSIYRYYEEEDDKERTELEF